MPAPCRARWITWPGSPPEEGASSCHVITWTKYQARGEQKCSSVNQLRMAPAGLVGFRDQVTHDQKPFWCAATMSQGPEHELGGPVDAEGRDEQPP